MASRNIVGHCYKPNLNADKVYMVGIREFSGQWHVIAKWGRRGKKLSNQDKGDFKSEREAAAYQQRLWNEKVGDGYRDITTPQYFASLTGFPISPLTLKSHGIVENLEPETGSSPNPTAQQIPNPVPTTHWICCVDCGAEFIPVNGSKKKCPDCVNKAEKAAEQKRKDDEAVAERERRKRNGEDDVLICVDNTGMEDRFDVGIEYLVEDHADLSMVYVIDKLGRKDEYFRTRFMTPDQWGKKNGKGSSLPVYEPKPNTVVQFIPALDSIVVDDGKMATMPTRKR